MKVAVVGGGFGRRVVAPVFAGTDGCEVVDVVSARDDDRGARVGGARPTSTSSACTRRRSCTRRTCGSRSRRARRCCATSRSRSTPTKPPSSKPRRAPRAWSRCATSSSATSRRARVLRELVADGVLGRIEHVQMTRISAGTRVPLRPWGWLFDRALGGGWVGAWGSHAVDSAALHLRRRGDRGAGVAAHRRAASAPTTTATCTSARPRTASARRSCCRTARRSRSTAGSRAVANWRRASRCSARTRWPRSSARRASRSGAPDGSRESIDLADATADRRRRRVISNRCAGSRKWCATRSTSGEIPAHAPTFADGRACDAVLDRLRARRRWSRFGACRAT